jgi:hypothetical protein
MNAKTSLVLLFLSSFTFLQIDAACTRTTVRKEWRTLGQDERERYVRAVLKMQNTELADGTTQYDQYPRIHLAIERRVHGNSVFLPWHRNFLYLFENDLKKFDKNVFIPYWFASYDGQALEASPLWDDNDYSLGDSVTFDDDGCVASGPFKDWKPSTPSKHCLQRDFQRTRNALPSIESVNDKLSTAMTFDQFARWVESDVHAYVHNYVGGDMRTMYSPNDPVFWLHHANVDRLWWLWQSLNPDRDNLYADGAAFHFLDTGRRQVVQATYDYKLPMYESTIVADVLDAKKLCYTYEDFDGTQEQVHAMNVKPKPVLSRRAEDPVKVVVEPISSVPVLRSPRNGDKDDQYEPELMKLREVQPLPEDYIKANGLNLTYVRENEARINGIVKKLNAMPGYVSPSALWNRPDLIKTLIKKKLATKFQSILDKVKVSVSVSDTASTIVNIGQLIKDKVKKAISDKTTPSPPADPHKVQKVSGKPVLEILKTKSPSM